MRKVNERNCPLIYLPSSLTFISLCLPPSGGDILVYFGLPSVGVGVRVRVRVRVGVRVGVGVRVCITFFVDKIPERLLGPG